MSYEALRKIASEAEDMESQCRHTEARAQSLALRRKSERTLCETLSLALQRSRPDEGEEALITVINEMKHDIMRIAEMRLAAKARELKVKAAQKRAVIHSSVLPIELEESE